MKKIEPFNTSYMPLESWKNLIESALFDFVLEYEFLESPEESPKKALRKLQPSQWSAGMQYANKACMFPGKINLKKSWRDYNLYFICQLADIFIDLCNIYDKESRIVDFSYLVGCHIDILYRWRDDITYNKVNQADYNIYINKYNMCSDVLNNTENNTEPEILPPGSGENVTKSIFNFFEKIRRNGELWLSGKLTSGSGSPVGRIAVANHVYGWASEAESRGENTERINLIDIKSRLGLPTAEKIEGKTDEKTAKSLENKGV